MVTHPQVIIIGAGLAGLTCAVKLHQAGIPLLILEADKNIGGRVQSDHFEDFKLDRGFQVLLTAYPLTREILDYDALKLHSFYPGAMVRKGDRFYKMADPFRHPLEAVLSAFAPVGTFDDKIKIAKLRQSLVKETVEAIFNGPESTIYECLQKEGFSDDIIDRFFRPFYGGILLDRDLKASSRMFEFIFKMFAEGDAAVPEGGMRAIPEQLAGKLPAGCIRTKTKVLSIQDGIVNLPHGETIGAGAIVVATDGPEAARLLGEFPAPRARSVSCLYYAAEHLPTEEAILFLNGNGVADGPVNNLCVISNVCPEYSASGISLISVSVLGYPQMDEQDLELAVRAHLVKWFPEEAAKWRYLKTYKIAYAQPDQSPAALTPPERTVKLRPGMYVCGDHRDNASINGAMASGVRTAAAVVQELSVWQ